MSATGLSRYDLGRDELAALLADEPAVPRRTRCSTGLYRRLAEPEELTELPGAPRSRLAARAGAGARPSRCVRRERRRPGLDGEVASRDAATARRIETVLMRYRDRTTVCVSSQAGCAMGCTFCATGDAGFGRQLSSGEIVEQVVIAARRCRRKAGASSATSC